MRPTPEVKLDILIPTYNRPRLLDVALRNAFSIALPQCRIVVIDDGSEISQELDDGTTLDTAGVVERNEDSRLVYHRFDRNRGLGAVFETYLAELLNGEYLMIVGDDDVLIDGAPIKKGLNLLDSESKLNAVMFPIRQKDHLGGITERFPVSFAYCYYQYVLRALKVLRRKDFMDVIISKNSCDNGLKLC